MQCCLGKGDETEGGEVWFDSWESSEHYISDLNMPLWPSFHRILCSKIQHSAQAGLNQAKTAEEAIGKAKDVLSWWLDKKVRPFNSL
jgi:hypothetical protein